MTTASPSRKLYLALCGNAALLGLILLSMWTRGVGPAPAMGQSPPQPATANGVTIMPGQLSPQTFGCYLLDADKQTLCVYQYAPGEHELRLAAARDVEYDRQLKAFNTSPPPADVQRLADRANQPTRVVAPAPQP